MLLLGNSEKFYKKITSQLFLNLCVLFEYLHIGIYYFLYLLIKQCLLVVNREKVLTKK